MVACLSRPRTWLGTGAEERQARQHTGFEHGDAHIRKASRLASFCQPCPYDLAPTVQIASATPKTITATLALERRLATALAEGPFDLAVAMVPRPTRTPTEKTPVVTY